MIGLQFTCDKCGAIFEMPNFIGGTGSVFMSGNTVSCPVPGCSGLGHHKTGTYDFVNGVVKAFTAPGITRANVADFAGIVSQAAEGKISVEVAVQQARHVSIAFGGLLKAAHEHGITFDRILALVLAIQVFWATHSSDADVQAALAESRNQTELSQKMLSELEELNASFPAPSSTPETQRQDQAQKSAERKRRFAEKKAALRGGTSLPTPQR